MSEARVCPECGGATLYVEFRDSFMRRGDSVPDPRSYGQWVVCQACGHDWTATPTGEGSSLAAAEADGT